MVERGNLGGISIIFRQGCGFCDWMGSGFGVLVVAFDFRVSVISDRNT